MRTPPVEDNHIKTDKEPHSKYQVNSDRPLACKGHSTYSLEATGPTEPDLPDSFMSYRVYLIAT